MSHSRENCAALWDDGTGSTDACPVHGNRGEAIGAAPRLELEDPCTLCGRHERTTGGTARVGGFALPIETCDQIASGTVYVMPKIGAFRFAEDDDPALAVPAYEWRPEERIALPVLSAAALRRTITDSMREAPSAPLHDPSTCAICTELASLLRSANNRDVPRLLASNFPEGEKEDTWPSA